MLSDNSRRKVKRFLKGTAIALVCIFGFFFFAFVEVAMSGSDLNNPSQGLWWLGLVGGDIAVTLGLITLIQRIK